MPPKRATLEKTAYMTPKMSSGSTTAHAMPKAAPWYLVLSSVFEISHRSCKKRFASPPNAAGPRISRSGMVGVSVTWS